MKGFASPRLRGEAGSHRRCDPGEGDSPRVGRQPLDARAIVERLEAEWGMNGFRNLKGELPTMSTELWIARR